MLGDRYLNDGIPTLRLSDEQVKAINEFLDFYENQKNEMEEYPCECGEKTHFDLLAEKDRYAIPMKTVICRKCGMIMTNPRMNQKNYDIFYKNYFGRIYRKDTNADSQEGIASRFLDRKENGFFLYDILERNYKKEYKSVLEIGCAAGGILKAFQEKGKEVTGIDLDDKYLDYGRSQGLNLLTGHSSTLVSKEKYDVIILSHVFEHFLDIESELDVISNIISEEGCLLIVVPGIVKVDEGDYGHNVLALLQNAHVRVFSLGTLTNVMGKYGFELIAGSEKIIALYKYTGNSQKEFKNYFLSNMCHMYFAEAKYLNE